MMAHQSGNPQKLNDRTTIFNPETWAGAAGKKLLSKLYEQGEDTEKQVHTSHSQLTKSQNFACILYGLSHTNFMSALIVEDTRGNPESEEAGGPSLATEGPN